MITRIQVLRSEMPTGIRMSVQQQMMPRQARKSPTGTKTNSHRQAFNNAPVSLNASPSSRVNIKRQTMIVIIKSLPMKVYVKKIVYTIVYMRSECKRKQC